MTRPGEILTSFLATATESAWLVAPFMISRATKRALEAIPERVNRITVVTRWRPDDVAAGVSDLGVLDVVTSRQGAKLLIHPRLHAKVYRADAATIVGSANLTDKALGWVADANLELLVPCHDHGLIEMFMSELLREAYPATAEIRATISLCIPETASTGGGQEPWLPRCASPNELWNVYAAEGLNHVLTSAQNAGRADLKALDLPSGLDRSTFEALVTERFDRMPLVRCVMAGMGPTVNDEQGAGLLIRVIPGEYIPYSDAGKAWNVFKRWLEAFGGGGFRSKSAGEVMVRERIL